MILLPLSQGLSAVVDDEDAHLAKHKWTLARRKGVDYAFRNLRPGPPHTEYLHHAVNGRPPKGMVTDHRDGDGLNCRRSNLRNATKGTNAVNRSTCSYRGIRQRPSGRWGAHLTVANRQVALGTFDTREEAQQARRSAAAVAFGEVRV